MISKDHLDVLKTALRMMGTDPDALGPCDLRTALKQCAAQHAIKLTDGHVNGVMTDIMSDDPNGDARRETWRYLLQWDYARAGWCGATEPNTRERRARVYDLLAFGQNERSRCDFLMPPRMDTEIATIIARDHEEWYTPERKQEHFFYWSAYARYLRQVGRWPEESIAQLDRSTDLVLQHLSEPRRDQIYQTKGLVVGYVQSGKTANFTAVIAKAADAGYRLFIILAGTLDILRNQTQRRLDKELIGKEQIRTYTPEGEEHDYARDSEWGDFIEHADLPSRMGSFDWHRLTGASFDYSSLGRGLSALEFEMQYPDRSLIAPENLDRCRARLVVIKKNPRILKRLISDLRGLVHTHLAEVPAILIDDESDQASVNTLRPESNERTKTNEQITELLRILPRAQYIGYTATPFANVFIDPGDAADLFPKDYIIALKKPVGYMGVQDFFDITGRDPSKERAFIRDVRGDDEGPDNLPKAMDSFVLAGAIKLYRQTRDARFKFKHHTMLVHRSHQMKDHDRDAELVQQMFENASYGSSAAFKRLDRRYGEFLKVSETQKEVGLPPMPTFRALKPYIHECVAMVRKEPVAVVNGDAKHREHAPDFERDPVWRILVGGTKLSRGYTIEGLTVSYYRRKAKNADTLMQMGRWFGFRRGYRDAVRLFLGRAEPDATDRPFDLVEAFKSICRDEEEFRGQLDRYASLQKPRITPAQIPPLVPAHLLRPTSRNKMWNAVLASQNLGEEWVERTLVPTEIGRIRSNAKLAAKMLRGCRFETANFTVRREGVTWRSSAHTCVVTKDVVLEFLENYVWSKPHGWEAVLAFVRGQMGDPGFDRWLILAPQLEHGDLPPWKGVVSPTFRVVERARADDPSKRFKTFSEPRHRKIMEHLIGVKPATAESVAARKYTLTRHAGVLVYPCLAEGEKEPTIGFALLFPNNSIEKRFAWRVQDAAKPDAVTVDLRTSRKGRSSAISQTKS